MRVTGAIVGLSIVLAASAAQADPKSGLSTIVEHGEDCAGADTVTSKESLLGTLAAMLIGPLVKAGVKGVGNALTEAAKPDEAHVVGMRPSTFYSVSFTDGTKLVQTNTCVRVVTGGKAGDPKGVLLKGNAEDPGEKTGSAWLKKARYTHAPNVYLEVRMVPAPDRTAFLFRPVNLYVGEPLTEGGFAGKGRDLTITLSVLEPAKGLESDTFATRAIVLKRVKPNTAITGAELERLSTDWIPMPGLSEELRTKLATAVQRRTDYALLVEAQKAKPTPTGPAQLTKMKTAMGVDEAYFAAVAPMTFRADVYEVRDGNKVMAAIGKYISDNSDKIAQPILEKVDPDERAKVAAAASSEEQTLRIAAIDKVEAWQAIEAKPASEATPGQKRIKKIEAAGACRALRAADLDDPVCAEL